VPDETIELTYPRNIDGHPRHVVAEAVAQWRELTPIVSAVADQLATQVRNEWHTRQVEAQPEGVELTPDELEQRWLRAPEREACRSLNLTVAAAQQSLVRLIALS
jgi:hypothetical protein